MSPTEEATARSRAIARGRAVFGTMKVIATDQGAGRKYRCGCGWEGWSTWGWARKHAEKCPEAHR